MHLFEIFLPTADKAGHPWPRSLFEEVRGELTDRFGGVTAFLRAPGQGLWRSTSGDVQEDDIAVIEVMCDHVDREWWSVYRRRLENQFDQDVVLIRVSSAETI